MSPKIPATRRSAAPCRRIEIVASRRVAIVWFVWLCLVACVVLFAVALPVLVRVAICVVAATANARSVAIGVLLRGERSIRALEWQEAGEFTALLGMALRPVPAELAAGSFRLGWLLLLRFETPVGMRFVLIDGPLQHVQSFRRLCRRLEWRLPGGSGRSLRPS